MSHTIALLASPDGLAGGIANTLDLLMAANRTARHYLGAEQPLFRARVVSQDGRPVRASNGYPIGVDGGLELAADADAIVIPGFTFNDTPRFKQALAEAAPLCGWLRARHAEGQLLAASCSGTFLLAEAGLLDGREATTTWWLAKLFRQRYPRVLLRQDELLVENDGVVCAGAALSQLDLTLYLIERLAGRQVAGLTAKFMVLDGRRPSQAPYVVPTYLQSRDPVVVKAEAWLAKHLREEIRLEELACELAVSPRTLIRRFQAATGLSPQAFLQRLRIDHARALMETTELRLVQILERIGYQDESAFRRLFKRHTSLSPGEYARKFGPRRKAAA